jgi:hypothetical protein
MVGRHHRHSRMHATCSRVAGGDSAESQRRKVRARDNVKMATDKGSVAVACPHTLHGRLRVDIHACPNGWGRTRSRRESGLQRIVF